MRRRRYLIWLVSAAIAVPVYFLGETFDLPQLLVLFLTFIAALAGSVLGTLVMRNR